MVAAGNGVANDAPVTRLLEKYTVFLLTGSAQKIAKVLKILLRRI